MPKAHTYRLKLTEGEPRRPDIEFEATDTYKALVVAHDRAHHHPAELWRDGGTMARRRNYGATAELWRDGERLCTIRRVNGEVWEIRPAERVFTEEPG